MKKTTLQKKIERSANIKTVSNNDTMHMVKQIEYNHLFNAMVEKKDMPYHIIEKYDTIYCKDCQYELLTYYNIPMALTKHMLKKLMSMGNMAAMELLENINHTINIDDCVQEVYLKFIELYSDSPMNWTIDIYGKVSFKDDFTMKEVFGVVSKYLYQFQTKHYKHIYIEIDKHLYDNEGKEIESYFEIVDVTKASQLAKYIDINNIIESDRIKHFMTGLSYHDKRWFTYRLNGYSNLAISKEMNVTYEKIRATEKRVKKAWEKFDK